MLAVVVGILHAALAPVIVVAGVRPNLVLIAVVLVTTFFGFLPGITWAFVAGLTANLLVGEPLGSIPLALLVVAAIAAGGSRAFGRASLVHPVLAVLVGSVVADVIVLVIGAVVGETVSLTVPLDVVTAAATLNAVIAALAVFPARLLAARYVADEAPAW